MSDLVCKCALATTNYCGLGIAVALSVAWIVSDSRASLFCINSRPCFRSNYNRRSKKKNWNKQ